MDFAPRGERVSAKDLDLRRGPVPLDVPSRHQTLRALFTAENHLAPLNVAHSVDPESRNGIAATLVYLRSPAMPGHAVGNNVAQEGRGADRVEFQDVIGGALVTRRVEDRACEVDVEKEDCAGVVHAEIQAGVAFAFKADEDFSCSAPEALIHR